MSWHNDWMTAFDLETTSADPETARIVTACVVHIKGAQTEERSWLVNPGVEIDPGAISVHGVTNERARAEGIDPATAAAQILSELDDAWTNHHPVVIFNAPFDLTILDRELRRHCGISLDGVIGPVIDPHVVDKHVSYRKGKRRLTETCEFYEVRLEGAHTSTGDALAAARVAWRLAQKYPQHLADLTKVNEVQAGWRAEQAASLEAHFRTQGKDEHVDPAWPLRPMVVTA